MKRLTSPLLLIVMLAAPALAKDDAIGSAGCPAARAEVGSETQALAESKQRDSARPASTDSALRPPERERNRNRPRWHSFIPGMIR